MSNRKEYNEKKQKKFTILDRLNQLPYSERKKANKALPVVLGISVSKYKRLLYKQIDSQEEISGKNLLQLADFFKCSPEELFTTPPSKIELGAVRLSESLNLTK